ncbi:MAG: bifunctional [glutamate--ammonia ligase]-adenylyl-L-tyrosine phosphorylase/[glutamate--ammonia-ligase] adenylyltransferase [Xanthomonadales bacterium]|nr:bifunctional [glutamate--ammonia ligase]-adenylyl-L-tyrosine phosphorylase/[glutamate--ammonia-ligase] adenylyltransferase [Gammaproteobacteria bacterium]MBT8053027.1 bifunctional [glutamate--ammonia ligase]-adenylyl-L-tyrosine phosphorylase/[glutamate--ammonia-ligase] adenylyltransferase [Gammaproteobacteria bacterium]NND57919.1 bifunctional [glutamate--ammonia ligase]-adenylyl-L-tyrosine phosphorylase/[glutamate--ammonia-ligase] adenylyltransferase [Xanthomonadales bacterium]NNK50799.1 bifu
MKIPYNEGMPSSRKKSGWNILPPVTVPVAERLDHVRFCSEFAAGLLGRFPAWEEGLDEACPPDVLHLAAAVREHGLDPGLRRFRNREMLRIVWRDLCGLAPLKETFNRLTSLAEICLGYAIDEHYRRLVEKHGTPRGDDGSPQQMFVIGLGKFGGGELNLSSDIDIIFCYPKTGVCDGRRGMANDQFFTRQARAVIASLSEMTADGFCFRVDTRLRPFGDSGPLTSSLAALEQYYQREGRDWERYALIKARPVAGDREAGERFLEEVRPFVYRRYIDYSAVEALQEMHANVSDDARRKGRLDDIKRGPGGIREIEFLAQCFQLLRGGRETRLQTPSLDTALSEIARLGLVSRRAVNEVRNDYAYLRFLENRIQAYRDQQTHRVPEGEDRERIARAMYEKDVKSLEESLRRTRARVSNRFQGIFPARTERPAGQKWSELWRQHQVRRQEPAVPDETRDNTPLDTFVRRLSRVALSQRANSRLDRFMPELLERIDRQSLEGEALARVFDLVLAICRRSAYLVLLEQNPKALDRMLDLFQRSEWITSQVIRFPALLDELIDPALGRQIPDQERLSQSVRRILEAAQGTEAILQGLNYLKLATQLRIAVSQLKGAIDGDTAQAALARLASALLAGVLDTAKIEIAARHGSFGDTEGTRGSADGMAIVGYGSLGAAELGYDSDLDIVFLFDCDLPQSNGDRPLPPERYFARLAQRVLSFLTVMTPSGRLYEVDTRLRPNGRAGSLVSHIGAFRKYQLHEAWTWELQALTRARFITGSRSLESAFNRIRQEVLCRQREERNLALELGEMRERMTREHTGKLSDDGILSPKHQPGGLIDVEFIAQLGVLSSARLFPRVIQATGTLHQLQELMAIGWLTEAEAQTLLNTVRQLRQQRMMTYLERQKTPQAIATGDARAVFVRKMGESSPALP